MYSPLNQVRRKCGLKNKPPLRKKKAEARAEKVAHRVAPAESRFYTIPYGLSLSPCALPI